MTETRNNPYAGMSDYKAKRATLRGLSVKAKVVQKQLAEAGTPVTVNQILLKMYAKGQNLEFRSFQEWKKEGKWVKKGESGYLIWSRPVKDLRKAEGKIEEAEQIDSDFFGTKYVFSSLQVR